MVLADKNSKFNMQIIKHEFACIWDCIYSLSIILFYNEIVLLK